MTEQLALNTGNALVDLLNRVVDGGIVISGDVVIALAGVDLIRLDLRALLVGVQTALERGDAS
jgi:hypothetical protein